MRSNDISQIEEYNRIITSHLADTNFCNHELNKNNLIREGINPEKIFVLGSTVYAAMSNMKISKLDNNIEKPYILLTLHRPENVDDPRHLDSLLKAVNSLNETIIFQCTQEQEKISKEILRSIRILYFLNPQIT